jgi:hypothetical protein
VLLPDLPSKTSHCLLERVTWIEADAAFPPHIPLPKMVVEPRAGARAW